MPNYSKRYAAEKNTARHGKNSAASTSFIPFLNTTHLNGVAMV